MKKPRLGSNPLSTPTGVNALIRDTRKSTQSKQRLQSTHKAFRLRRSKRRSSRATQGRAAGGADQGLPLGWTRATFIIRKSLLETLRNRATFRKNIKTTLDEALHAHLHGKAKKGLT